MLPRCLARVDPESQGMIRVNSCKADLSEGPHHETGSGAPLYDRQEDQLLFTSREIWVDHPLREDGDCVAKLCWPFYRTLWLLTVRPVVILGLISGAILAGVLALSKYQGLRSFAVATVVAIIGQVLFSRLTTGTVMGHMKGWRRNPFIQNQMRGYTAYELCDAVLRYTEAQSAGSLGVATKEEHRLALRRWLQLLVCVSASIVVWTFFRLAGGLRWALPSASSYAGKGTSPLDWLNIACWVVLGPTAFLVFALYITCLQVTHYQIAIFSAKLLASRLSHTTSVLSTVNEKQVPRGNDGGGDGTTGDRPATFPNARAFVEEYLVVQHTVKSLSTTWQASIGFGLITSLLLFLFSMVTIIFTKDTSIASNAIIAAVVVLLPLLFPARLNSRLQGIMEVCMCAGPNDWRDLGSRDAFLKPYIESNAIMYTIFGFPITYSWLLAIGSGLSTLLITVISAKLGLSMD